MSDPQKAASAGVNVVAGIVLGELWIEHVTESLVSLGLALLIFGVVPCWGARILSWAFPKGDDRRREMVAEVRRVAVVERLWWLVSQIDYALFDGLGARVGARRSRRALGDIRWSMDRDDLDLFKRFWFRDRPPLDRLVKKTLRRMPYDHTWVRVLRRRGLPWQARRALRSYGSAYRVLLTTTRGADGSQVEIAVIRLPVRDRGSKVYGKPPYSVAPKVLGTPVSAVGRQRELERERRGQRARSRMGDPEFTSEGGA